MAARSVIDTLDLCTTIGVQTGSPTSSKGIGWLSPRISFSSGVVDKTPIAEVEISEIFLREKQLSGEDRAFDFEFCMATSSLDSVSGGGCMLPADELFHKGKLLPQCLPPLFPRQEKVSVSFSGPLDMHEQPSVTVAMPLQREDTTSVNIPGPSNREETAGLSFSGPLHRQDRIFSRFSGPLERQQRTSTVFSGPLSFENVTSCIPLAPSQGAGTRLPKSPKWEKVFGLLRRARSDSHRDLCSENEQVSAPSKVSILAPKNSSSAANSLRLIFRRTSSMEKGVKANSSETSQLRLESGVSNSSSSGPPPPCSRSHPSASPDLSPAPAFHDNSSGLSVLHVASPVYPTQSASERDAEEDLWSSSATAVDLRPGTWRNSWRMSETESSLDITFEKSDKLISTDSKRILDRGGFGITPATTNSSRIVFKNLERCSNPPCKGGKGQEQLRALRTREIRRSPERLASYSSSVRVTPVLNVPVCIGPALRSSKSAKGRLASVRSFLSFKKDKDGKSLSSPAIGA